MGIHLPNRKKSGEIFRSCIIVKNQTGVFFASDRIRPAYPDQHHPSAKAWREIVWCHKSHEVFRPVSRVPDHQKPVTSWLLTIIQFHSLLYKKTGDSNEKIKTMNRNELPSWVWTPIYRGNWQLCSYTWDEKFTCDSIFPWYKPIHNIHLCRNNYWMQ